MTMKVDAVGRVVDAEEAEDYIGAVTMANHYGFSFTAERLIKEYKEMNVIIHCGKIVTVREYTGSMTGKLPRETIFWPAETEATK